MPNYIDLTDYVDPTAKLFGERLKLLRVKAGLTQMQLASKTGITAAYISAIERGKGNPTLDMMVKLAGHVNAEAWDMIRPSCDPNGSSDLDQNG